jgi:hypothetical protein
MTMRGLSLANNAGVPPATPAYPKINTRNSLINVSYCMNRQQIPVMHQHGCSVRVLPLKRLSHPETIQGAGLPGTRNLQWHTSYRIPHPEGKSQQNKRAQ